MAEARSRLKQLNEDRRKALTDARALNEKAASEKRDLTEEESRAYDQHLSDYTSLGERIERELDLEKREKEADDERRELEKRATKPVRNDPDGEGGDGSDGDPPIEHRALASILERMESRGWQGVVPGAPDREQRAAVYDEAGRGALKPLQSPEYRAAFRDYVSNRGSLGAAAAKVPEEFRALQADDFSQGGALVAPVDFQRDLIQAVDDVVYLRQFGTVRAVRNAQALGFPSLDTDPADSDWTSELATGSEDSSMALGGRELHPHPLAKRLKISGKLLRLDSGAESLVRERLAYKFGVTAEKAGMTGTGSGQPLGVFTASAKGISTSRDVSTDNTTTAVTMDGLKNAKYALKGNYWARARWLFHRDAVKMVAKLKDGRGQYLWAESVRVGEPDRLLGLPALMSEYAPNTFTTGLYAGLLGDLSYYWWADALGMTIQRLNELYAETNQVGFIGRMESDGMPVLEEAFVRVTLA